MTILHRLVPAVIALLIVFSPAVLAAQDQEMAAEEGHVAMLVDAENADYAEVAPGVHKAILWGDEATGPHGAFTHFNAGQEAPLHTHPNDIRIVVLEGAYIFTPQEGEEVRVEAGSYFVVPGGVVHVSAGDAEAGALFYETTEEGFGMELVDE